MFCNLLIFSVCCGERGIRTPETVSPFTRFPGVPLQPLEHLSMRYATRISVCFRKTDCKNNLSHAIISKKAILFTFYPQFKTQIGRQASSNCVLMPGRPLYAPLKALRLRRSRAGRQMTAEVRKLAKEPHSTLLLNFLMTVLG